MTNQCRHGQLARVCLICEQVAEIERLTATVAGLRESANLRVRYHAAELADVTAERDEAREEVARLKDARVQFGGADAAEIERLRDQLHLAEVARAAQVEGVVQGACILRDERNEAHEQVEIYASERDEARAAWSNRTQELERMEVERDALQAQVAALRIFIASDSLAITFQTMGQYRTALLRRIDGASEQRADSDCTPNHLCHGRMVHLPSGEQCDRCGHE